MKRLTLLAAALALVLTGCSAVGPEPTLTESALLTEHGLADMSVMEIIDTLDRMPVDDRPTDLIAAVRPDALILTDNVREVSLAMPDDVTYVSVAPFVEQTHECYFHSLTTCRGELSRQPIDVRIVDHATGDVIRNESVTTYDNGFTGLWLPRDVTGTIEVTYDGMSGSTPFSTANDAASCITTLQLT